MSQVVFWFVFVRRLSSLKIYRVESVVDGKRIGGKGLISTVPSATNDCVNRYFNSKYRVRRRHNANYSISIPVVTGIDTVLDGALSIGVKVIGSSD